VNPYATNYDQRRRTFDVQAVNQFLKDPNLFRQKIIEYKQDQEDEFQDLVQRTEVKQMRVEQLKQAMKNRIQATQKPPEQG